MRNEDGGPEKRKTPARRDQEIAAALNLTPTRIQQLVHEGLPKKHRGKYDKDECIGWYIRYLQALVKKNAIMDDGGKVFASERQERLRQMTADADLTEIKLARERSQIVLTADVEKEMADLVLNTKARVLAIASRVAPELVGENSRTMVQAKIEKALKEALVQLERGSREQ